MVPVVDGVRVVGTSVGGDIMTLAGGTDVSVDDDLAIDGNLDMVTLYTDLLCTPFTQGFVHYPLGGDDSVDGTMDLVLAQVGIHRGVMVKDLNFAHSIIGGIDTHGGPYADTIVHSLAEEAELETVDKIAVLLLGVEVARAAVAGSDVDCSVDGNITFHITLPLVQVGAVEEHLEALLLLFGSQL